MPMVGPTIGKAAGPFVGTPKAPTVLGHGPQTPSVSKGLPGKPGKLGPAPSGGVKAPKAPKAPTNPYLPAGLKANNPLLQPSQQLSGADLFNAAMGLTNASTAAPLATLAKEIAGTNANTAGQAALGSGYFNQLGSLASRGFTDAQQVGTDLNSTLTGIGSQETAGVNQAGQNAVNSLNQYTPPGGDNAAGMSQLQQAIASSQGLTAQDVGNNRSFGASVGAIGSSLAGNALGVDALAGTQALRSIYGDGAKALEPLNATRAGIIAGEPADLSKNLGALRQTEVGNQLARNTLAADTALKQAAINASTTNATNATNAANTRAANSITAAGQRQQAALTAALQRTGLVQAGDTARQAAALAAKQKAAAAKGTTAGGAKPLTTYEQNRSYQELDRIGAIFANPPAGYTPTQLKAALISGSNTLKVSYPAYLVQAALELNTTGAISPATARQMHAAGLRGGSYNGKPITVNSGTSGSVNGVSGSVNGVVNGITSGLSGITG